MQNSHAGIIRRLSIATTIISLLCALLFGFLLAGFGLGGIAMNDPDLREQASYSLEVDPADVQSLEDLGIPASDPASMVDWVLGLGSTFFGRPDGCLRGRVHREHHGHTQRQAGR